MASGPLASEVSQLDRPRVSDIPQLDSLNTSELIHFLKGEFRSLYFNKIEQILLRRENKMRLEREEEHARFKQMSKAVDDLETELGVCRNRCSELSSTVLKLETKNRDLEHLRVENAFQKKRYGELVRRVAMLEKEVSDLSSEKSEFGLDRGTQVFDASGGAGHDEGATINDFDKSLTNIKVERTLSSATNHNNGRLTENVIDIIDSENESEENSKENQTNNIETTLKKKRRLILGSDNEDEDADGEVNLLDPKETKDDFVKLLSGIRRWKNSEAKWQYEVDMVSAFDADSRLCMRAVCALYRHPTFEEKGFGQRISFLGKFLLDGAHEGEMKKTVKELETFDPNGITKCRWLAKRYSKVLFTIYQNKEDPFFP